MKIVLDTNIIVSDFRMRSPSFQVLLENCKKRIGQVYIPKIVKDESINKFRQRLQEVKSMTEKELKVYNDLTDSHTKPILSEKEIDVEVKKYTDFIEQQIKDYKIIELSYPDTPHEVIAKRAMNKRKPFNSNGAGYRDNLIWENIKKLITQDEEILILPELIFITNNYKDFATPEYDLHSDLVNELNDEYYNPESIQIYSKLSEYIDEKVKVDLKVERRLQEKLKNREFDVLDLHTITSKYLFDNLIGYELINYDIGLPQEYETPTISSLSEDYVIDDISVKKLSASKILIEVSFELEVYIDFFIFKADYWCLDEEEQPSIVDSDWNDHYMLAETTDYINITMSILIDSKFEVLSCQIDKINKNYAQHAV